MKHFQKNTIYLVVLTMNFVFIQNNLLSQNDSLVNNDSFNIGGLYKVTLITGEETLSEIKSYDTVSIKVISNGNVIGIKSSKIKSIEEYTYILRLSMGKKGKEEATVTLKDGTSYQGRLLSILPVKKYELNEKDNTRIKYNILEIERDKIFRVFIHGNYNVLSGLGYGALIGAGLGAIIGYANGDDGPGFLSITAEGKALLAGIVLGLVGGLVGGTVGLISSTPDEIIMIDSDDDYDQLKKYVSFPFGDPSNYKNQNKKYKK